MPGIGQPGFLYWDGFKYTLIPTPSVTGTGPATGDLGGNYPSPTVIGIQGIPISSILPSTGQSLIFNGASWSPTPSFSVSVTGSGLWHSVNGVLQSNASMGAAGQFSVTNSGASDVTWISLSGDVISSPTSPGKITATGIQGNPISSTTPSIGNTLSWNGTTWTTTPLQLGGGLNYVSGVLPEINQALQAMFGDVTGTTATSTVVGLQDNPIKAQTLNSLQDGYVLTWNHVGGWQAEQNTVTMPNLGGDVIGTASSNTIVTISGFSNNTSVHSNLLPTDITYSLGSFSDRWSIGWMQNGISAGTSVSGAGHNFTIQAENAKIGSNANSGNIILSLGIPDGTGNDGYVIMQGADGYDFLNFAFYPGVGSFISGNTTMAIPMLFTPGLNNAPTGEIGAYMAIQSQNGDGISTNGGDIIISPGSGGGGSGGNGYLSLKNQHTTNVADGGSVSLPANCVGFLTIKINNVAFNIPYYNIHVS